MCDDAPIQKTMHLLLNRDDMAQGQRGYIEFRLWVQE